MHNGRSSPEGAWSSPAKVCVWGKFGKSKSGYNPKSNYNKRDLLVSFVSSVPLRVTLCVTVLRRRDADACDLLHEVDQVLHDRWLPPHLLPARTLGQGVGAAPGAVVIEVCPVEGAL